MMAGQPDQLPAAPRGTAGRSACRRHPLGGEPVPGARQVPDTGFCYPIHRHGRLRSRTPPRLSSWPSASSHTTSQSAGIGNRRPLLTGTLDRSTDRRAKPPADQGGTRPGPSCLAPNPSVAESAVAPSIDVSTRYRVRPEVRAGRTGSSMGLRGGEWAAVVGPSERFAVRSWVLHVRSVSAAGLVR